MLKNDIKLNVSRETYKFLFFLAINYGIIIKSS